MGVGDSFASVVGSKFGRTKFPDSPKSVEGTLASIGSQMAFLGLIRWLGAVEKDLATFLVPVSVVALAEAQLTQVDNVVLPILLYAFL